jgi:uncharacterized protein (TIGR03067 family)
MRARIVAVLVFGLFLLTAAHADDASKKDHEKLQGTWTTVSAEQNGEKLDEELVKALKFVVKDDVFAVDGPAVVLKEYVKGTFKIDASVMPRMIDIKVGEGDKKGDMIEGIYEFDGDNLKICAKLVGKERPINFKTEAGSSMVSLVLKREKK